MPVYGKVVGGYNPTLSSGIAQINSRSGKIPSGYNPESHSAFRNLLEDSKNAAIGFFPGLAKLGVDIGHDVAKTATSPFSKSIFGEYRLDDFAKAIYSDYKYTYGPALSGDVKTTGERIRQHPLGPILDVLAAVTGGVGFAAKGAKSTGLKNTGLSSSTRDSLMKFAGYERGGLGDIMLRSYDPKTNRYVGSRESTKSAIERSGGSVSDDVLDAIEAGRSSGLSILDDPVITSTLKARRVHVDTDGNVWKPREISFKVGDNADHVVRLAQNPVRALRQQAVGRLGATELLRDKPVIGVERRAARNVMQQAKQERGRAIDQSVGMFGQLAKGVDSRQMDFIPAFLHSTGFREANRERQISAIDDVRSNKVGKAEEALASKRSSLEKASSAAKRHAQLAQKQRGYAQKKTPFAETQAARAANNEKLSKSHQSRADKLSVAIAAIEKQLSDGSVGRPKKGRVAAREVALRGDLARINSPFNIAQLAALQHGVDSDAFRQAIVDLPPDDVKLISGNVERVRSLMQHFADSEKSFATPAVEKFGKRVAEEKGVPARDIAEVRSKFDPLLLSDRFNESELELLHDYLNRKSLGDDAAAVVAEKMSSPSSLDESKTIQQVAEETIEEEVLRLKGLGLDVSRPVIVSMKGSITEKPTGRRGSSSVRKGKIHETEYLNLKDALNTYSLQGAVQAMQSTMDAVYASKVFEGALGMAEAVPVGTHRKGWKLIHTDGDHTALSRKLDEMHEYLTEDLAVLTGGEIPQHVKQLVDSIEHILEPGSGMSYIVPDIVHRTLFPQLVRESAAMRKWVDNPTRIWKAWTLGARPAWMVGNLVSNLILSTISIGVLRTVKGLVEAPFNGKFLDNQYGDIINSGFINDNLVDMQKHDRKGESLEESATRSAVRRGRDALTGVALAPEHLMKLNAKLIDNPIRRQLFWSLLKPHVKNMQKQLQAKGRDVSPSDAAQILLEDGQVADIIGGRVLDDLVNFRDMSELERKTIRRIFPFYAWVKGISGKTARMMIDKPVASNAIFNWIAQYGDKAFQEDFENMPEWMRSFIRLEDSPDGSARVVGLDPLSPFSAFGDVAEWAQGASSDSSSSTPLSSMAPLPKAFIESMTKQDLFTRKTPWQLDEKRGGDPSMSGTELFSRRFAEQFPQVRAYRELTGGPPYPSENSSLDPRTREQIIRRYFTGVDVRDVNSANARASAIRSELERRRKELEVQGA